MTRALAAALALAPVFLAAAQGRDEPGRLIERVAADFIDAASQPWSDFSICEHRSKTDDTRAFLHKSFGKGLFPASASVNWKELQVGEEGASSSLHLGLVAVTFREQSEAIRAHSRLQAAEEPYLKGTKILTRYKALLRGSTVLIIYSETFSHEALQRFFATLALPSE
jgi:hypothetical protein